MKRLNKKQKQHHHSGVVIVVAIICITLCSCKKYWCKRIDGNYIIDEYVVYKFSEGEDYSRYFLISDDFKLQPSVKPGINRPIPLHNGYYLSPPPTDRGPWSITYLNFTYDELESGLVPDDWNHHWEEYVLVDCPYKEYYSVGFPNCGDELEVELENLPGYCTQCHNTYNVDTVWLNNAIDNGVFFHLESVTRKI